MLRNRYNFLYGFSVQRLKVLAPHKNLLYYLVMEVENEVGAVPNPGFV